MCEESMLTAPGSGYTATWANYSSLPTHTQTDQGAITQFRDKEEEIVGLHSPPSNDGLGVGQVHKPIPGETERISAFANVEASREAAM